MGKGTAETAKSPSEDGLDDDMCLRALEVLHQSHSLHKLRKEGSNDSYSKRYHEETSGNGSIPQREHIELWWLHLRHRTNILPLPGFQCQ